MITVKGVRAGINPAHTVDDINIVFMLLPC